MSGLAIVDVELDGWPWQAVRLPGGARASAAEYRPKTQAPQGDEPVRATYQTFHRGSGASRKLVPGMIAWTKNGDPTQPGIWLPGPARYAVALANANADVPPQGMLEDNGALLVAAGQFVNRVTAALDAPVATLEKDLGAGYVAKAMVRFKRSVIVGGTGGPIWELPSGAAWTNVVTGTAGVVRGAMAVVNWVIAGATYEVLVAEDDLFGVRYVQGDPRRDADWTPGPAAARIPTGGYPINTLVATADHAYIATTGGLRDLDSTGRAPNLTPEIESLVLSTNGLATLAAGGYVYMGAGYGLLRVRVVGSLTYALPEWVTPPGPGRANETPVRGVVTALARKGETIYCAQYDELANTTYVSYGRDAAEGELGPMTWACSPIVLEGWKVTAMRVSGLAARDPRLWMAATNGVARQLFWAHLAIDTPYQDLRAGGKYRFTTAAELLLSDEDYGGSSILYDLDEVVAETEGVGAGSSLAVQVAKDGSEAYAPIGTITSGPRAVMQPNAEVLASRLRTKLVASGLPAQPPVLRRLEARAIPVSEQRELRTYQFLVGQDVRASSGQELQMRPEHAKLRLERLMTGPRVTFRDEDLKTYRVRVLGGVRIGEVDRRVQGETERYLAVTARLLLLNQTALASATYDAGDAYDDSTRRYDG